METPVKNDMLWRDCEICEHKRIDRRMVCQGIDMIPVVAYYCRAEIGEDMKCPKNPFIRVDRL